MTVTVALPEFVRVAMDASILHWRAQVASWEEAKDCLWMINGYNEFDPAKVIECLEPIVPDLGSIEIGREYSPVIYVTLPFWHHQKMGHKGEGGELAVTEAERNHIGVRFLDAAYRAKADEVDNVTAADLGITKHYEYRAWWD